GGEDAQRNDNGARPAGHGVDVEVRPGRTEHHLRRHRGAILVGELAEQCQVELGETVNALRAAVGTNDLPGATHVRRVGVVAGQLQGEVRLDGAAQLHRTARVIAPAAA